MHREKEQTKESSHRKRRRGYALRSQYSWLFFPLAVFYMEMTVQLYCYGKITFPSVIYILLFSLALGMWMMTLVFLFRGRARTVAALVLLGLVTLLMGIQTVYYTIFSTFTTLSSAAQGVGAALSNFWKQALAGIWHAGLCLLFLFVPLIFHAVYGRKLTTGGRLGWKGALALVLVGVVFQLSGGLLVRCDQKGVMSSQKVYTQIFSPDLSVPRFGIVTTLRLDLQNLLWGDKRPASDRSDLSGEVMQEPAEEEQPLTKPEETAPSRSPSPEPVTYANRVLEIDFDALIASETNADIADMHEYFRDVTPTTDNEYTGMFRDYNLIWIVAEGFSSWALDETHTPTLYKLSQEGFVFNNFYNPVWGVSTSDGEYVATTGLIPKSGVWSYARSADNAMPFAFGNLFSELGCYPRAYHNHDYTYYDRNLSHPNMGYDYKGLGNGLDVEETWPESDVEMMEKTIGEYIGEDRFMTYYMTVSGHLEYNFDGNYMCWKHQDEVADLPYSEGPRAYIACQMEFDQAVALLLEELEQAGRLDDTVIVISGDHYPYGLELSEIEELAGEEVETNFELYRSTLIIWNSRMETVEVDKYCSSLDIMPTLANLFDLPVDSRLVMGRDILSDAPALVIFSNRSFITDYGRYDSTTDTFTPREGVTMPDGYAGRILDVVNQKFYYSAAILDYDYYRIVLGDS